MADETAVPPTFTPFLRFIFPHISKATLVSNTDETTFKQRVELFWQWFADYADELVRHIDQGQAELTEERDPNMESDFGSQSEIAQKVNAVMDKWLPGFNYVFGSESGKGYSFTLSPNGDVDLRFLAGYWLAQAPKLDGWRFYSSRQPGLDGGFTIEIEGANFSTDDVRFGFEVDQEKEVVDVVVWHPDFVEDDDINSQVAFIFLDEALGEIGTEMWIGKIGLTDTEPENSIVITSLATEVVSLASMHQWEKQTPDKTYTGYSVEKPGGDYPRSDTIAGATCHFKLVGEFMEREGLLSGDPIAPYGARFVYLAIDATDFDPDNEVQRRADIEEMLNDLLVERGGGRVLGGATGINHAYIDLLLVDGQNSLDLVRQSMEVQNLAMRYRVEPFFDPATV